MKPSWGMLPRSLRPVLIHVLIVRRDGKKDILIPDIDSVVLKIDLEKGEIRVHLPTGLIPDGPS